MTTILVTGATGTVGSILVPLLRGRGVTVRALVRDPSRLHAALTGTDVRAGSLPAGDIHTVVGDFADPESIRTAVDGVDAVFLACANVPDQVAYECAVVDAAEKAGVRSIVKLSARGAAFDDPVAYWHWHAVIERHLAASGIPAVVLQPGFLMTNLLAATGQVRSQGALFAPAGTARIAMIDPADVARAAAVVLTEKGHDGHTYVLTGPTAISYQRVAAELSAAVGRPIGFVDIPSEVAGPALVEAGLPSFAAEQVVAVFDALRQGAQSWTTDAVHSLTGSPARTFAEFARDHADAFRSPEALTLNA